MQKNWFCYCFLALKWVRNCSVLFSTKYFWGFKFSNTKPIFHPTLLYNFYSSIVHTYPSGLKGMSNEIEMSLPGMPGLLKVQANPCKQLLTPLFFSHKKTRYLHWKTELVFRAMIQIFLGTVFVMLVMAVPFWIHSSRELVPLKKPDPPTSVLR